MVATVFIVGASGSGPRKKIEFLEAIQHAVRTVTVTKSLRGHIVTHVRNYEATQEAVEEYANHLQTISSKRLH